MVISRMQAREYAERLGFGAEVAAKAMESGEGGGSRLLGCKLESCTDLWAFAGLDARRSQLGGGCGWRWRSTSRCCWPRWSAGSLTGSLAVLADAGHLLSDVGSIVLALIAARLASLPARPAHLRLPALRGAGGAGQRAAAGRGQRRHRLGGDRAALRPPRSTAPGAGTGLLGLAGNLAATWVLARGQREDINLEGVLRHSVADALGSLGVVSPAVRPARRLRHRRPDRRPADRRPGPRLLLALDQGAFEVLMEAAPADLDVDGSARRSAARRGCARSTTSRLDRHRRLRRAVRPRRRRPGCDRDLVRRRLELTLAERFGIEHTTLQMEEEADQALLQVENAPAAKGPSQGRLQV